MSIKNFILRFSLWIKGIPTCKKMEELTYDFLDGKLEAKETQAIEKHMSLCPPCIRFMEAYRRIKELGKKEEAPPIPREFKQHLQKMFQN